MEFKNLVKHVLNEESMAGGTDSVFGPNVTSTSSGSSGDNYAAGDARNVHGLYAGVLSRSGMRYKKKRKTKKK